MKEEMLDNQDSLSIWVVVSRGFNMKRRQCFFFFLCAHENIIPDPCQSVGAIFFGGDFKCTLACLARGSPQGGYCDDDNVCNCNTIT